MISRTKTLRTVFVTVILTALSVLSPDEMWRPVRTAGLLGL